jgi:hypothetical protein
MSYFGETSKNGVPDGEGVWIDENGTLTWEGIWKNGKKYTGEGKLYEHGKFYYNGGIRMGKYNGKGTESSSGIQREYKDGNYHGSFFSSYDT